MNRWTMLILVALLLPCPAPAADVPEKDVDDVAQSALDTFAAPGLAIAVVRDDKVIYLKGHGVREVGTNDKVTPDTVFPIMSCSKAYTATAVAVMIDDGKMKWDDPVRKHLPSFRLSDPLTDRDVTIRDLLCHRTGIIRHDILWYRSPLTRAELLGRMAFLPQDKPFRAEYHYNNFMFLAAGQAAGAAGGSTWEDIVRERIFKPLGMKSSVCSVKEALATPEHVSAHQRNADGKAERMDWLDIENMGPAGAIATTARDATRWLRMQLNDGQLDGKRIVSAAHIKETHTAQQVVRRTPQAEAIWPSDTTDHLSYGLGWNVHDYRGHLVFSHGGALPGFRSHTVLVPRAKLGLIVLSNMGNVEGGGSRLPEAVVKNLLDRYLGLPTRDWNEFTKKAEAKALADWKKKEADREKERIKGTKPSRDLAAYAGSYDDPAYGQARILREGDKLTLEWSSFRCPLEHFHLDTFTVTGEPHLQRWGLDDRVVFRLGTNGKVEGMTFVTREFKKAKEPAPALPATKKETVKDVYHGVTVTDDYRWLEDGKSKAVQAWSDAENAYARSVLDKLPGVEPIREQVKKILTAKTVSHGSLKYRGGKLFTIKRQPPREQPFLVVMPSPEQPDKARVLVDPTAIDTKGTTAIDFFVPSPDGKLVAVSLSKGGSESGDVHIYDVESGKQVHEVVPRVYGGTAGGDLVWKPDGKGFFYTRYPHGDERPEKDRDFYQQVYYHELGTPTEKDRYEMGKDLPRIAEIMLEMHDPTGRLLVSVQDGDSGRFAHFLRSPDGKFTQFSDFGDGVVDAVFGPRGDIYAVSRKDAPRGKILRLSGEKPTLGDAKVIVPEGKDTIVTDFYRYVSPQTVLPTANLLYVLYQLGGPSELRVFDLDGKALPKPEQLEIGTVRGLPRLDGDDVIFANGSYVRPLEQYLYSAKNGKTERLPLTSGSGADLGDIRVVREFATSKDGTKVPVNIMIPKGATLDGKNPCLVTGYGGYGLSREPSFRPAWRVLFDRGFIIAEANLRGGSEYGEDWHKAGMLTKKQNVFDDFAAAIEHMIAKKYTSPERLAIEGGSNGGLLMGATLTQHPDLMKAVVAHVGIYDMLRVELSPNGAFNIPEFGTVKDEAQFKALHAYSPLHNVKDGTKYPAVLFLTGANDPRVDPMQSRKMTARLQAATASKAPILLRTSASSGHGLDTSLSERIEEYVDVFAFLCAQLGVKAAQAKQP